jgi:hypothetical protein
MRTMRAVRGARLPQIYKSQERKGNPLPHHLAPAAPCFSPSLPGCAPPCSRPLLASSSCAAANRNGSPPANRGAGSAAVEPLDGDGVRLARARERRSAGAERGGVAVTTRPGKYRTIA